MSIDSPGCVILLLDESAGMSAAMGEVVSDGKASTKPNVERVATAVNALLNQLAAGPDFDLALVGYRADATAPSMSAAGSAVRWPAASSSRLGGCAARP